MAHEHLATYLNDHLAGSVVALELLENLEEIHANAPLAAFFSKLRADIEADRQELETLMGRLEIAESRTRKGVSLACGKDHRTQAEAGRLSRRGSAFVRVARSPLTRYRRQKIIVAGPGHRC